MERTIWDALCEVPDRRGRRGRQIALPSILVLSLAGMLSGADSLIALFRWGRRLRPEALRLLGFSDGRAPCHATYHYVFKSLDADALSRTLGDFALGGTAPGHLALDGKSLRGSRREGERAIHVLSAFATDLSVVVGDLAVAPEQNEITAALTLLKGLPLEGTVITGDAMFCQREICRHIRGSGGDYLFAVKGNQPDLQDCIASAFGEPSPLRRPDAQTIRPDVG